jgi:DNA-binding FadR family transcriptional regulator
MESALIETELVVARNRDMTGASLHFHTALITASHNDITAQVDEFLFGILRYSRTATLTTSERRKASLAAPAHKLIFSKVKARDSKGARSAMLKHLHMLEAMLPKA